MLASTAATGHINTPILVRDKDASACYLEGRPDVTIFDGAGQTLAQAVGAQGGETFFDDGPVVQVLMQPGTPPLPAALAHVQPSRGQGLMNVEWYDCRGTVAAEISINLPDAGGALKVAYHFQAPYSPACDGTGLPAVGLLRGPVSPAGYAWPPGPVYMTVNVVISAPASAKHGSTLVYFVTLQNADQADYPLDTCPDYGELLAPKKALATYQLNCAPVGHIAPGASVKFEMHLDIPPDVAAGPNQLTWELLDGRLATPFAHAAIDIT